MWSCGLWPRVTYKLWHRKSSAKRPRVPPSSIEVVTPVAGRCVNVSRTSRKPWRFSRRKTNVREHMSAMPMAKGGKGKVAHKTASKAKSTNRKPEGLDAKTTYPLTKDKSVAGRGANRNLHGADKRRIGKGVVVPKGKGKRGLAGMYF